MPCLIGCLAMGLPRLTVFALWLFSDWFVPVFKSNLWFFLGFLFMPMTTLAYGWSWHRGQGEHDGLGITVIVIGVAFDLGLIRIGRPRRRRMGGGRVFRAQSAVGGHARLLLLLSVADVVLHEKI